MALSEQKETSDDSRARGWQITKGNVQNVVELLKAHRDLGFPSPPHGERIYASGRFNPYEQVIWEDDFKSIAEYEAWRAEFFATPAAGDHSQRVWELIEPRGSRTEVWTVEHLR